MTQWDTKGYNEAMWKYLLVVSLVLIAISAYNPQVGAAILPYVMLGGFLAFTVVAYAFLTAIALTVIFIFVLFPICSVIAHKSKEL